MIIGASAEGPMIFAFRFLDWKVIDAREPQPHQAIIIEFPILVAVRAIPVSGVVVPFIGKAHGDSIVRESPKLLDQAVVEFLRPFTCEKSDDVLSSVYNL